MALEVHQFLALELQTVFAPLQFALPPEDLFLGGGQLSFRLQKGEALLLDGELCIVEFGSDIDELRLELGDLALKRALIPLDRRVPLGGEEKLDFLQLLPHLAETLRLLSLALQAIHLALDLGDDVANA